MLRSSFVVSLLWFVVGWLGALVAAPAQGWVDRTGPNGPAARYGHAMCYDPVRGYVLMVGQHANSSGSGYQANTWSWDGATWTARGGAPASTGGCGSALYAMVTHAATGEVFLMAVDGCGSLTSSIYRWDGTSWANVASGLGSYGGGRNKFAMGCDPVRNQSVLFTTYDPSRVSVYDGVAWSNRFVTSVPTGLPNNNNYYDAVSMAFDPSVGKLVLVVTNGNGSPFTARFFEWNGFGWNQRLPLTLPPWGLAAMSTDTMRNRVVAVDGDYLSTLPNHTWSYSNGVMTQLVTPVEPSLRLSTAMAYDPVRGVHVLFGGIHHYPLADTWELDLGPLATFTPYGTGCAGSRGVPQLVAQTNSLPRIGQTFTTRTSNLPWTGPALMLLGVSDTNYSGTPLPVDLSMLNAPGCFLRTSIEDVQPLQNVLGTATWSFVIPPVPGATFYLQTVPFDGVANPLGLTFSNGGRAVVGL